MIPTSLIQICLRLLATKRTGTIPAEFGKLKKLTYLLLTKPTFGIDSFLLLATALQVLRLDYNRLVGPVPDGLAKRLMVFDASHNPGLAPAR